MVPSCCVTWNGIPRMPQRHYISRLDKPILLITPPHTAIGSRITEEQWPPLGVLSEGGPVLDAGFKVSLINGEFGPMPLPKIVRHAASHHP